MKYHLSNDTLIFKGNSTHSIATTALLYEYSGSEEMVCLMFDETNYSQKQTSH
jgi:hypothetical protein